MLRRGVPPGSLNDVTDEAWRCLIWLSWMTNAKEVIPMDCMAGKILCAMRRKKRAFRPSNPAPACQSWFPRWQDPTPQSGVRTYYEADNPRGAPSPKYLKQVIRNPPVGGNNIDSPGDRPGRLSLTFRLSPLFFIRMFARFCSNEINGLPIIRHVLKPVVFSGAQDTMRANWHWRVHHSSWNHLSSSVPPRFGPVSRRKL